MRSKSAEKVKLSSFDDLFGKEEPVSGEVVTSVPIDLLHPFKNHPFHVQDDEKMEETVESVKQYGILMPGIVRPYPDGGYEVVAGHRRWRACELAGLEEMPVIIRDIDDDTATVIMVDTNIQREDILPSEKAFAYKMKYEALKHQGSKGEKYTAEMVGETAGDSGRTVQRYIRLANLISGLLDLVDVKKVPMIVGEKLSYLTREEQELVLEAVRNCEIMPTTAQAEAIKMFSEEKKLDGNVIYGGRLPYHVRLLLDEFANIGQIPKFDKLIATIRSREISASIILQSQSQLKTIYKDAAETILGNCDTMLFLGGKEGSTLKEISETLGKETIDLYNTSDTRGQSRSYGLNYQKTGKELMSRDELAVMDGDKCILQLRGVRPFYSNKFDITKHRRYRELADYDKKNTFDVEAYLKHQFEIRKKEEFELFEVEGKQVDTEISEQV